VARAPQVVLASESPRRADLLRQLGIVFTVDAAAIDESAVPGESPVALAMRLAEAKARTVLARRTDDLPVLAADTIVVLDGRVLGKPADEAEGVAMLLSLAARAHEVVTAVALATRARSACAVSTTKVHFRAVDAAEAHAYWATGEASDKAGGYGIQGVGGIFVDHIEGSYSGVVGLPVAATESLLRAFGVDTWRYRVR
jgi:septum formation protein